MQCLDNLVDVWDGTTARDSNKVYINDLPGFELSNAEYISDTERTDGMQVLATCKSEAILHLIEDFRMALDERAKYSSILSNQIAGKYDENLREKAVESKLKGVQISVPSYPYLSLYIDRISLFAKSAVTTNILVYDLQQGVQIDSFPITTIAGQITTIEVGKEYKNKGQYLNLVFLIDASLSITYNTFTSRQCGHCFYNLEPISKFTSGRGVSIGNSDTKIEANLRGESHTSGLSITYSVQCDPTYFLCNMANRFKLALRYRWGMEVSNFILNSKRSNSLTTVHKDDAEKNLVAWKDGYENGMKAVFQNLRIPNNACYSCIPDVSMTSKYA